MPGKAARQAHFSLSRRPRPRFMLVPMVAGEFIVGVCAVGGVIACIGFGWAARNGQFSATDEARYLVFDEGDDPRGRADARTRGRAEAP